MTNKEQYYQLCQQQDIALHSQAWWMEATSIGKEWDVLLLQEGCRLIGALPYHIFSKYGQKVLVMPAHTQQVTIWIADDADKFSVYEQIVRQLDQLCKQKHIGYFYQQGYFDEIVRSIFLKHQFIIKDRRSYRIDDIPEKQDLFRSFSTNKQRQITKAKGFHVTDISIDDFYKFHKHCLSQRHLNIDYSLTLLTALGEQALSRQQGRFIACKNTDNILIAAIFLVWDQHICYYLMPTYDSDFKNNGAMAWLTMQAMLWAREKGLSFDFEGSMNSRIALSYQQFGTYETHYYSVEKWYSSKLRLLSKIYHWIHK